MLAPAPGLFSKRFPVSGDGYDAQQSGDEVMPALAKWNKEQSPTGSFGTDFLYYLLVKPFMDPLLRFFAPYDRGDFRWEFLTPWLDRELTKLDKFIVTVTFIWLALVLQIFFDPEAQFSDHLSYIAFFFSYAMGNPIGYRLIALVASSFEIYSHLVETTAVSAIDAIPVGYNVLFMVINL